METFNNDPKIKRQLLTRIRKRYNAGLILKGKARDKGYGFIACIAAADADPVNNDQPINPSYLQELTEMGIPRKLLFLTQQISWSLPGKTKQDLEYCRKLPERFIKAIRPGADLSKVVPDLIVWGRSINPSCSTFWEDAICTWASFWAYDPTRKGLGKVRYKMLEKQLLKLIKNC